MVESRERHMQARSDEYWAQAQAAIQAEIDRDVFEEAAGLAEAELAQIGMSWVVADSVGRFILVDIGCDRLHGLLTGVSRSGDWIFLNHDSCIRLEAVRSIRGVNRWVSPVPDSQACDPVNPVNTGARKQTLRSWLSDHAGAHIRLHAGEFMNAGVVVEVGADFLVIRSDLDEKPVGVRGPTFIPFRGIDHLRIMN